VAPLLTNQGKTSMTSDFFTKVKLLN